jgi:DNA-binding transcriptional regulator YiaG
MNADIRMHCKINTCNKDVCPANHGQDTGRFVLDTRRVDFTFMQAMFQEFDGMHEFCQAACAARGFGVMHDASSNTVTNHGDSRQQQAAWVTPRDKQIGSHIQLRRTRLGMSQWTLARRLGIVEEEVEAYEQGLNWIGTPRLFKIADILDVGIASFYTETPAGDFRSRSAAPEATSGQTQAASYGES